MESGPNLATPVIARSHHLSCNTKIFAVAAGAQLEEGMPLSLGGIRFALLAVLSGHFNWEHLGMLDLDQGSTLPNMQEQ